MIGMGQKSQDQIARMSAAQQAPPMPVDPHASLTAPIYPAPPKMSAGTNELGDTTSNTNELGDALPEQAEAPPAKMSALDQQKDRLNTRLMGDYSKDTTPAKGFLGHLMSGIDNYLPGVAEQFRGTRDWREKNEEPGLEKRVQDIGKQESEEGLQGATQAHTEAETPEIAPNAESARKLQGAETDKDESEVNNPSLATAYAHAVTQAIKENRDPAQDPIVQHLSDAITSLQKPTNPEQPKTTDIKGADGKVHTMGYDDKTGKYDVDEGESGFKPAVTNVNENHQFAEQERGRGLLDAAEKQYRTAQQGANTMRDMLASANAGNKMSGQMLPLEGALAITTAQGVHRINRTEVDQYQGGGTLYDSVAGRLGKLATGQPMDASLRADVEKLTDIQEKAAYQNYKDAYGSATRRYGLTGEQALPEPGGGASGSPQPGDVKPGAGGNYRFKGGDQYDQKNWELVKGK